MRILGGLFLSRSHVCQPGALAKPSIKMRHLFFLWSVILELTLARLVSRSAGESQKASIEKKLAELDLDMIGVPGLHDWYLETGHLSADEVCVTMRSLEWLADSLVEPSREITSRAGQSIFVETDKQGGPLVVSRLFFHVAAGLAKRTSLCYVLSWSGLERYKK